MTHWKSYQLRRKHTSKALCTWSRFHQIDSFSMFKNQKLIKLVKESTDRICLTVPAHNLVATLHDDNSIEVNFNNSSYTIPVEKRSCNFGGFYYFFHCPQCDRRMRKLYCINGRYICRKCANLGYYSQRLSPSQRFGMMRQNTEKFLKERAGSLEQKPPWMKKHTFQKLRRKYVKYDEKRFYALNKEVSKLVWGLEYVGRRLSLLFEYARCVC